ANIGNFSTTLDIMKFISGDYSINAILIEDANFFIKVLKDGKANYDITIPTEEVTEEEVADDSAPFELALKKYELKNVNFTYDDKLYVTYMKMEGLNHSGKGDFTMDNFDLETKSTIKAFTMGYDGITYLKNTAVDMKADLGINMPEFKFTFKENEISLNQLKLKLDGWLAMPSDPIDMDLKIEAPGSTFKSILSLIPAVYSKDFEGIETSGNFSFGADFKGRYDDNSL